MQMRPTSTSRSVAFKVPLNEIFFQEAQNFQRSSPSTLRGYGWIGALPVAFDLEASQATSVFQMTRIFCLLPTKVIKNAWMTGIIWSEWLQECRLAHRHI